jgi:hypothetical protein
MTAADSGSTDSFCSQATASAAGLNMTGTVTYNADGTYSESTKITGTVTVNLPAACLKQQGITLTCDQLNQAMAQRNSQISSSSASNSSLHCSGTGGGGNGCACSASIAQDDSTSGTYSIQGSRLIDSDGSGADFCVQGDTLYEQSPKQTTMTMGALGNTLLGARAVLTRKK